MALKNVRIGALDPDTTREFGRVSGYENARELLRLHRRLYPAELLAALRLKVNESRSKVLVAAEVEAAARAHFGEGLPDGFEVVGANVHGEETTREKFVGVTYRIASGRTGKLAVAYTREAFPQSVQRGDEQVRIDEARRLGVPYTGGEVTVAGGPSAAEIEALINARVEQRVAELMKKLGGGKPAASSKAEAADDEVPEPWDGYDKLRNTDVIARLREEGSAELARAVIAYENGPYGKARASVITAANEVIDSAQE